MLSDLRYVMSEASANEETDRRREAKKENKYFLFIFNSICNKKTARHEHIICYEGLLCHFICILLYVSLHYFKKEISTPAATAEPITPEMFDAMQ